VSAFRLGLKPSYSLADALARADHLDEFLEKIAVRWRSFDLITAPDSSLGLMGDHLERLPQVLAEARRSYSAVIADMPPSLYAAGLEAMRSAQTVYLVCTPDLTSLHLARRRVNELLESGFERNQVRVILNRFDSRRAVAPADIERVIGAPVFFQLANDYDGVHRAAVTGGLVMPESELGRDLEALAERVAGGAEVVEKHASGWKKLLGLR
jgi:Flp pilus assembly CpaE family ATPase